MELSAKDVMGKLMDIVNIYLDRCLDCNKLSSDDKNYINQNYLKYIKERQKEDRNISADDVSNKLQYFFINWVKIRPVFEHQNVGRSYINVLKVMRNGWAHKPISNDDLEYACNTALRLAHLSNDTKMILDLEEIFEYIHQKKNSSQTDETVVYNTDEIIEDRVIFWSQVYLNNQLSALCNFNHGIMKEFYTLVLKNYCYPWEKYKHLYKTFVEFIVHEDEFHNKFNHHPEFDALSAFKDGLKSIDDGYITFDHYFSVTKIPIYVPIYISELLTLITEFFEPEDELAFFSLESSIKSIFKFVDVFYEEIQKLDTLSEYPLIELILQNKVNCNDINLLMPNLKPNDEGEEISSGKDSGKDELRPLATKFLSIISDGKLEIIKPAKIIVESGRYPNTDHFSDGSTSFALGYNKILSIFRYYPQITKFVEGEFVDLNLISKFKDSDVICLPSTDNCDVMFGRTKAKILVESIGYAVFTFLIGNFKLDEIITIMKNWENKD